MTVRTTLQELSPKAAPSAVNAAMSTETMILMICFLLITVAIRVYNWGPRKFLIFGESGGMNRLYQLAEWFGPCDFIAEREGQYKHASRNVPVSSRFFEKKK